MSTPHFETELELIADHLEVGDEVYVLTCQGELGTCFANYAHQESLCMSCRARCTKGLSLLDRHVNVMRYPFAQQTRYSEIPDAISDFDTLKAFQVGKAQIGLGAASSLVTHLNGEHHIDTIRYRNEVTTELNTAYYVYKAFRQVLVELKPDLVYLFNGRFSTVLPALNACEELNVPYLTHDRGGTLDRYQVVANSMPQGIVVTQKEIQALCENNPGVSLFSCGAQFFTDRRARVEHSWYSFLEGQRVNALPEIFDKAKKNIAIFNSTMEEFIAIRDLGDHVRIYKDEIEALNEICSTFANDPFYHFFLRVHPNLKGREITQTREIRSLFGRLANLTIIPPESEVDSYALMEQSAVTVTFGSTMGVEASFWGKPSILLGRALYGDLDCVYAPHSHREVVELLRSDLPPKSRSNALKYGFWELKHGRLFRHYKPESLTAGTFMGTRIKPSLPRRVWIAMYRVLENFESRWLAGIGSKIRPSGKS
jgi:hypothetical protein